MDSLYAECLLLLQPIHFHLPPEINQRLCLAIHTLPCLNQLVSFIRIDVTWDSSVRMTGAPASRVIPPIRQSNLPRTCVELCTRSKFKIFCKCYINTEKYFWLVNIETTILRRVKDT